MAQIDDETRVATSPADTSDEEEEDDYQVVETQGPQSLVQQVLALDLSRQPTYTQALVGGASGWVSGFAFSKVGKALAVALGGSLLLIHLGNRTGYITIDWERLDKDMKEAQNNLQKKVSGRRSRRATKTFMKQGTKFMTKNMIAVGGFLGGFLLGMAT